MAVASRLPVRVPRVDLGRRTVSGCTSSGSSDEEDSVIKVGYRADNLRWCGSRVIIWNACSSPARPGRGKPPAAWPLPTAAVTGTTCFGYPFMRILIVEDEKIPGGPAGGTAAPVRLCYQ